MIKCILLLKVITQITSIEHPAHNLAEEHTIPALSCATDPMCVTFNIFYSVIVLMHLSFVGSMFQDRRITTGNVPICPRYDKRTDDCD